MILSEGFPDNFSPIGRFNLIQVCNQLFSPSAFANMLDEASNVSRFDVFLCFSKYTFVYFIFVVVFSLNSFKLVNWRHNYCLEACYRSTNMRCMV